MRAARVSISPEAESKFDLLLISRRGFWGGRERKGDRVLYSCQAARGRHFRLGGAFPNTVWAAFSPVGQYQKVAFCSRQSIG